MPHSSFFCLGRDFWFRRAIHIPGGQFGIEFLEFNGSTTTAGLARSRFITVLPGADLLNRQELDQLWWRQKLFRDTLILKLGKLNGHQRVFIPCSCRCRCQES